MFLNSLVDAYHFACNAHRFQRRKNNGSTYMLHLTDVAQLLSRAGVDIDIIIAGILHDTLEDTKVSIEDIREKFGVEVSDYVIEVSDDKKLSKGMRKKLQVEKIRKASYGAKLIKMADKYSNLSDLIDDPPQGWSDDDIQDYFIWSREVVKDHLYLSEYFTEIFKEMFSRKLKNGNPVIPDDDLIQQRLEVYYNK